MKKLLKKVWNFIRCFYMTAYGLSVFGLISWLSIFSIGFGYEHSTFICYLASFMQLLLIVYFLPAVYDDFKNQVYAYKNWEYYKVR